MTESNIAAVPEGDAEMQEAIQEARDSIKDFFDALMSSSPTQTSFLVKIAFVCGDDVEHIWVADLEFNEDTTTGVLADAPKRKDLKFMQRVEIDFTYLSDWMYLEDGRLVGGFTTRLLLKRLSPQERERAFRELPYRIESL